MKALVVSAIGGQKRIQGVNLGSSNAKRDIPMYADLYLQGRMNLDDPVSRTIPLRDINNGYDSLKSGSLNACLSRRSHPIEQGETG